MVNLTWHKIWTCFIMGTLAVSLTHFCKDRPVIKQQKVFNLHGTLGILFSKVN